MLKVNNPHRSRVHVNSATIDITMDRDVKRSETITLTLNNFGVGLTVTGRGEGIEEEQEQDYPTVLSPPLFSEAAASLAAAHKGRHQSSHPMGDKGGKESRSCNPYI